MITQKELSVNVRMRTPRALRKQNKAANRNEINDTPKNKPLIWPRNYFLYVAWIAFSILSSSLLFSLVILCIHFYTNFEANIECVFCFYFVICGVCICMVFYFFFFFFLNSTVINQWWTKYCKQYLVTYPPSPHYFPCYLRCSL